MAPANGRVVYTLHPWQRRSRRMWREQRALINKKINKSTCSGDGHPNAMKLPCVLTRNTPTIILPPSSILCLWFCKIPFCRGLASQARDAAPQQSSLALSPSGDKHSGPSGATDRQEMEMGSASPVCSKGAWEWGVTFSDAEEVCSGFLISLSTETKSFCPRWDERFHRTKTDVPQMYSGQT